MGIKSLGSRIVISLLEYEMLPTHSLLKSWFPTGGVILGGSGNFRSWSLVKGRGHWETCPWRLSCPKSLSLSLSASFLP
jgi:hypothetical protein